MGRLVSIVLCLRKLRGHRAQLCSSTIDSKYNWRPDLQLEPGGGGPGLGAGEAGEGVQGDSGEQHGARAADLVTSALPPLPQAANLHHTRVYIAAPRENMIGEGNTQPLLC